MQSIFAQPASIREEPLNGEWLVPCVAVRLVSKGVHAVLVLSRRLQEKIVLPGLGVTIEVVAVQPGVVRLGIDAPPEVTILRSELFDRSVEWDPPETLPAERPRLYRDHSASRHTGPLLPR
jgi:carbon storage regulator CsrA